jgi:hypothetical protein
MRKSGGLAMRIRFLVAGVLLGGLASLAWTGDSQALLIDDFSTDQGLSAISPDVFARDQISGSGILGGERDVELTLVANMGVAMTVQNGDLAYGHFGPSLGTALIVWDGGDGSHLLDPTGLGGIDFTEGGAEDKIAIPLLSSDSSAPVTLTAYTDSANFSTATVSLPGSVPPLQSLVVPFTDFVNAGGSGADFTNIGAFSLYIDGSSTPGLTVQLDSVTPEPSTGTLLLFGILMLASIRRYHLAS